MKITKHALSQHRLAFYADSVLCWTSVLAGDGVTAADAALTATGGERTRMFDVVVLSAPTAVKRNPQVQIPDSYPPV